MKRANVSTSRRRKVSTSQPGNVAALGERIATRLAAARAARVDPKLVHVPAGPAPKPKKKKRAKLARTADPVPCVILAIDAADTSGYAIWRGGLLLSFGEVDVFGNMPSHVLDTVLAMGGPHVLVVERPFYVKSGSSTGIGTADKIWREMAKRRGFAKRIVRVYPSTWRAVTLPRGMASAKRDVVRPVEMSFAQGIVAAQISPFYADTLGHDAAAAILIGEWASNAGEVLAVLPKGRAKKASKQLTLEGAA